MGAEELAEVAAAAEANRQAVAAQEKAGERQRQAIYAALDSGDSITEVYRTAGISRSRINQLISQRK